MARLGEMIDGRSEMGWEVGKYVCKCGRVSIISVDSEKTKTLNLVCTDSACGASVTVSAGGIIAAMNEDAPAKEK